MSDHLKDLIQKKVISQKLSDNQFDTLMTLKEGVRQACHQAQRRDQEIEGQTDGSGDKGRALMNQFALRWRRAVAASVALFAVIGGTFMIQQYQKPLRHVSQLSEQAGVVEAISQEVAKNHIKMKPLEVRSSKLSEVQRYFTMLDFSPIESTLRFADQAHALLGARYCSIRGVTAAQLRYQAGSGLSTLYEVPYDAALFGDLPNIDRGDEPIQSYSKGVSVKIWVEKGLLLVSAQNVD